MIQRSLKSRAAIRTKPRSVLGVSIATLMASIFPLSFIPSSARAAASTWNGGATGNWDTPGNWSPAAVPGSSADVLFTGGLSVINGGADAANSISLNGAGGSVVTLGGGGGAITLTSGTGVGSNGVVAGTVAITGGGEVVITSTLSGQNLIVNGNTTGTLELGGASTFTGTTSVFSGTLQVGNSSSGNLTSTGGVAVSNGASLVINLPGGSTFSPAVSLNGSSAGLEFSQSLGTNTISGVISGSGVVEQNGTGTTILTNTETYTGATNITAGTLEVSSTGSIAAGSAVNVNGVTGGTLDLAGGTVNGNVTLTNNGTVSGALGTIVGTLGVTNGVWSATSGTVEGLVTASGGAFTINSGANLTALSGVDVTGGTITGSGTLTGSLNYTSASSSTFAGVIAGTGSTLTMNNAASTLTLAGVSTYTGATTVSAGTLQVGNGITGNLTGTSGVTVANNATLAINLGDGGTFAPGVALNGANASLNAIQSGTNTLSGVISGSGVVNQNGTGTTILTNAETYTGVTTVNAGTLQIGDGVTTGTTIATSGQVQVNAPGTLAIDLSNGSTFANAVALNAGNASLNAVQSGTNTLSGVISGSGVVNQNGTGTTILTNAETYTGVTTVNAGTLQIGDGVTTGTTVATSGQVQVNATGTLAINLSSGSTFANAVALHAGNASLNTIQSGTNTLSGVISGSGVVNQNGTGTTILTNTETYTGATTVNAGTLQVGNGTTGNLINTSGVTVANNATLATNLGNGATFAPGVALNGASASLNAIQSGTNTLSGVIGGGGVVNQNGTGTTILTNTDTYTGATTVNAGTLQVGNGATGNLTGTSGVTVANNATLATNLGVGGAFAPGIALNGTNASLNAIQSGTNTLSGVISGSGVLNQNGAGTTILTNTETYTGATTVNAGTLQVGNGITGNLINTSGVTVANNATLATNLSDGATFTTVVALNGTNASFNAIQSGTNTLSGVISGSGVVNQNGTGTTILTGANTYTGATTINAGTLQIGNGGAGGRLGAGNVVDNGMLTFDLSSSPTVSNVISGHGGLNQNGPGTTILTASNTYTGTTNVNAGTLQVDGSIASANTNVNAGAQLQGIGLIGGNVNNNGTVKPGDAPGTLTLRGNYAQTNAGNLLIEIGSPSNFGKLTIGGAARLAGSLTVVPYNGFRLSAGETFQFLTAAGGVTGAFSSFNTEIGSAGVLLKLGVDYGPNSVTLVVSQDSIVRILKKIPGISGNLLHLAGALDSAANDPRAARIFAVLTADNLNQLTKDLQVISPDQLLDLSNVGASVSKIHNLNLQNRMEALQSGVTGFSAMGFQITDNSSDSSAGYAGPSGPDGEGGKEVVSPPPPADNRWGSFITGAGEFDRIGDTQSARGFNVDSGGITLGADYRFTDHFVAGLFTGYSYTGIDIATGGRIAVDAGKVGFYGTYFDGGFYVDGAVQGGYNAYDTNRTGLDGTAHSSPVGGDLNLLFAPGYNWKKGGFTFGPTSRFQYSYESTNGFTETGSLAPMTVASEHTESLVSAFGMKASYDWKVGSVIIRPELRLEWEHEYGDVATTVSSQLASGAGDAFTVTGPEIGRDSLHVGAGFGIVLSERVSAYVYYDGELFRTNYESSTVGGGFRFVF